MTDFKNSNSKEIILFSSTLTEKIGILINLLANQYKITLICPIYETYNGIEQYDANLFGDVHYTDINLYISQLDTYVGIHTAYINNVRIILCHHFNIFNQTLQNKSPTVLNDLIQNQQYYQDSAELFLQRAVILKECCEKLILQQKSQSSQHQHNFNIQFIISTDSFSILAALYIANYFRNINDITSVITQELSQSDQYSHKQIDNIMLYLTNYRNMYINKNDLKGYKINDYNYCIKLLNYLHVDINDITDKYVYNRLFPLRLALNQIENIVTDEHTEEQINKSQLYNWISHDNYVVEDSMQGLLEIEKELRI